MKRTLKRILVFLCAALMVLTCFACEQPDTRTTEQKAWDRLAEIPLGYYGVNYDESDKNGWTKGTDNRVDDVYISKIGDDYIIEVLSGIDEGLVLTVKSFYKKTANIAWFTCEQSGTYDLWDSCNRFGILMTGKKFYVKNKNYI